MDHPRRPAKKRRLSSADLKAVKAVFREELSKITGELKVVCRQSVREELHGHLGNRSITIGGSLRSIDGPLDRPLYLKFTGKPPPEGFAEVDDWGQHLSVRLLTQDGTLVETGPESSAMLEVVALDGDFVKELWTADDFENFIQRERSGRRPLLVGNLSATLKNGEAKLGEVKFTDNSSCRVSKKFRLGIRVVEGQPVKDRIREAKTEAFRVKDSRGKSNEKHHPPCPQDEVWRLEHIRKDGPTHRILMKHDVLTVEKFCQAHERPNNWLRNLLKMKMSTKKYDATIKHAKESEPMGGCTEERSANCTYTVAAQWGTGQEQLQQQQQSRSALKWRKVRTFFLCHHVWKKSAALAVWIRELSALCENEGQSLPCV